MVRVSVGIHRSAWRPARGAEAEAASGTPAGAPEAAPAVLPAADGHDGVFDGRWAAPSGAARWTGATGQLDEHGPGTSAGEDMQLPRISSRRGSLNSRRGSTGSLKAALGRPLQAADDGEVPGGSSRKAPGSSGKGTANVEAPRIGSFDVYSFRQPYEV